MSGIGLALLVVAAGQLPAWDFSGAESSVWEANGHIETMGQDAEGLHVRGTGWDPFFSCRTMDFQATPWQYVVITVQATKSGRGELFWSGTLEGELGGLNQLKSTGFEVVGDKVLREVTLFPGWQGEGRIRQMRLDFYGDSEFVVKSVAVKTWAGADAAGSTRQSWKLEEWFHVEGTGYWWAPPLNLSVDDAPYVSVSASGGNATAVFYWGTANSGMQREEFSISADGPPVYDLDVGSYPSWTTPVVLMGIELPSDSKARVTDVSVTTTPQAPAWLEVSYFGFDNGVNRPGRVERLRAHVVNRGGATGHLRDVELALPEDVKLVRGPEPAELTVPAGGFADMFWEVEAASAGTHSLGLQADLGDGRQHAKDYAITWEPAADLPAAAYVPEPKPVKPVVDVCAYYFPGWGSDASWEPVRATAPVRKPLLGWYDESKVEVVDWQIKWAVENGINCFLVDWYWNQGGQYLTHWFEAYRQAKYRDQLKVAIMWANHNPKGSHSVEDWRAVTREWIDRYFNLPAYYRIGNKPAVFIWDPNLIRGDIGADAVAAMYEESQVMARAAGYEGIAFVGMHDHEASAQAEILLKEGYVGATNYHEWGKAPEMAPSKAEIQFSDVVATSPATWARRRETCGPLTYYPIVDTGWDSRPWHGAESLVIQGRDVVGFEALLRESRAFVEEHELPFVVLGPLNEWGEGSYIEPNTEYGFGMYEAIRNVFGTGDPAEWPLNIGPRDVGLGPYDYPPQPVVTSWEFEKDAEGWATMMSVSSFRVEDGALCFKTDSNDGAIHIATPRLQAEDFSKLVIEMSLTAPTPGDSLLQLFFAPGGRSTSEAASYPEPVTMDGTMRTYTIDLTKNMRWRGKISRLRLDPCSVAGVEVRIGRVGFE